MNLSQIIHKLKLLVAEAEHKPEVSDELKQKMAGENFKKFDLELTQVEHKVNKAAGGKGELHISGIASSDAVDRDGQKMDIKSAKVSPTGGKVPMLAFHDSSRVIGSWLKWEINAEGKLSVQGVVKESYDPLVYEQIINKDLNGLSIGFIFDWDKIQRDPVNNAMTFVEAEIVEVSVVSVPSNRDGEIDIAAEGKQKKSEVATKAAEGEGTGEAQPIETASSEVEPPKTEAPATPPVDAEPKPEEKIQALQTELDALRVENGQLKQERDELNAELAEVDTLLQETSEVVEQLREEKELKHEIKK